jgi:hypothetical protein
MRSIVRILIVFLSCVGLFAGCAEKKEKANPNDGSAGSLSTPKAGKNPPAPPPPPGK